MLLVMVTCTYSPTLKMPGGITDLDNLSGRLSQVAQPLGAAMAACRSAINPYCNPVIIIPIL